MSHLQTNNRGNRTGLSRGAVLGLCAALALAFLAAPTAAQLTGRLAGQVMDADGAPLPGATITVNSPNLMGSRTDFADAEGSFSFPSLPPGVYTVDAELDGFVPQQRIEVEVRLNRATEVRFSMLVSEFAEEVVVTAETPVVDPEQVSTAVTFSTDYLEKAAVSSLFRSYQTMLEQAGGVAGGSNPNVYGSTLGENAWYVDGANTTDPVTATWGLNLPYDAIQEVNFELGGYEARYGGATGGVINVVTKAGGNRFAGSVDLRYRDTDFNTNGEHFDKDANITEFSEPSVTFRGPITRDKLWFSTAANPVRSKGTPTGSVLTRDFDGTNLFGRITWQARDDYQIVGRYHGEDTAIHNDNAGRLVAAEAGSRQDQAAQIVGATLLAVPTSNLQWEFQATIIRNSLDAYPESGDFDTIGHVDSFGDGSRTVNYTNQQFSDRERDEYNTSLTWFTDGAAGDHELRFGIVHADNFFRTQNNSTGGGYSFGDRFGQPYTFLFSPIEASTNNDGRSLTAYAEDTWRATPNLTLKFGVRNDEVSFTNDVGEEVANMSKLQPRIGFAWDITGDSKTVVRANWGRYMHPNALTLPSFARVNSEPTVRWISCSTFRSSLGANCRDAYPGEQTVGGLTFPNWTSDPVGFDPNGWFFNTTFASTPSTIVPDLRPTFADQWQVGVERHLARRTSIALTYIDKETSDIFEDTCNGNIPTPREGADCDYYVMANLPGLTREYRGAVLEFVSRFTDWMELRGSYTRSDSEGNVGYTQNAGTAFDVYPVHFDNRYGYMADHRKHRVKFNGYVDLPLDFGVGFRTFWWSPFVYSSTQPGDPYGTEFLEPRGSREAPDNQYRIDLYVTRYFDLPGNLRLNVIGSVHNALDSEQVTSICGSLPGCAGVDQHTASAYRQPRSFEVGLRLTY
ncbi:MAG: TonB-dependent receptor [Acidobacteria bacterium]|nr:TonB-dependent receptor [Acidobacteriota bacterium]